MMLSGTLIPNLQARAMGNKCGPHIFTCEAFADLSSSVEYGDGAIGLDLANAPY
jgi:hypothetical protein